MRMGEESNVNTPYKSSFRLIHELKDRVGTELGLSDWCLILQEDINTFGRLTNDEQWIHVDEERCSKESPFKKPVAHGFFILSLASRFAYECFEIKELAMGLNYGLNKVRFITAVTAGSRIRGRISLISYEDIPHGAKYIMNFVIELEGQEKPACVAEIIGHGYHK